LDYKIIYLQNIAECTHIYIMYLTYRLAVKLQSIYRITTSKISERRPYDGSHLGGGYISKMSYYCLTSHNLKYIQPNKMLNNEQNIQVHIRAIIHPRLTLSLLTSTRRSVQTNTGN